MISYLREVNNVETAVKMLMTSCQENIVTSVGSTIGPVPLRVQRVTRLTEKFRRWSDS